MLIAADNKNHHRPLDRSPIHGHVIVFHLQRIPCVAVSTVSLYHSLLHITVCCKYTAIEGFLFWSKDVKMARQEGQAVCRMFECLQLHGI